MPAAKPTPITPEGRRAAERVRMLFYSIAAANIVFIAIIMWLGKGRTDPAKPSAPETPAPAQIVAPEVPPKRQEKP